MLVSFYAPSVGKENYKYHLEFVPSAGTTVECKKDMALKRAIMHIQYRTQEIAQVTRAELEKNTRDHSKKENSVCKNPFLPSFAFLLRTKHANSHTSIQQLSNI